MFDACFSAAAGARWWMALHSVVTRCVWVLVSCSAQAIRTGVCVRQVAGWPLGCCPFQRMRLHFMPTIRLLFVMDQISLLEVHYNGGGNMMRMCMPQRLKLLFACEAYDAKPACHLHPHWLEYEFAFPAFTSLRGRTETACVLLTRHGVRMV